jgi:homoserine dehydrogenase
VSSSTVVLKFGGSVLTSEEALHRAIAEIYRYARDGEKVVAVVSAFKGVTDQLLRLADSYCAPPASTLSPYLLAIGEHRSAVLLALAAERSGLKTRLRTPSEIGLRAEGERMSATPVAIDSKVLKEDLQKVDLVVIPGFLAETQERETVLLGRGGTDLSAVFIAIALGARIRLLKDVDGVYDTDPTLAGDAAQPFSTLSFEEAKRLAHPLVQNKAIGLASAHGLNIDVAAIGRGYETRIGKATEKRRFISSKEKLKIAVLGCGVIGGRVIERLQEWSDLFSVERILVRNVTSRHNHALASRFTADARSFSKESVDVFIDAGVGVQPSTTLIENFLKRGISVISANKQAVVSGGPLLKKSAQDNGALFLYSAAVGGGAPFLESAERAAKHGKICEFEAVLNGTSNFVLDKCRMGATLNAALAEARHLGFAEPDSTADLDGTDAAAKLKLLSEFAFPGKTLTKMVVEPILAERLEPSEGKILRYVARCWQDGDHLSGSIRLEALEVDHFLASAAGEENCLALTFEDGTIWRITGKGAGPWPTSESILADLLSLSRSLEQKYAA